MDDYISRQAAIDAINKLMEIHFDRRVVLKKARDVVEQLPPAQPEQHIDADGTLWVTVPDIEQVKRVIVDEEKSKFCRQFYMEEGQRTGKWILDRSGAYCCSECMEPCAGYVMMKPRDKFCKMCGARMTEGDAE